jgi:hypothetical protein
VSTAALIVKHWLRIAQPLVQLCWLALCSGALLIADRGIELEHGRLKAGFAYRPATAHLCGAVVCGVFSTECYLAVR